jgi:hypothetical protein
MAKYTVKMNVQFEGIYAESPEEAEEIAIDILIHGDASAYWTTLGIEKKED